MSNRLMKSLLAASILAGSAAAAYAETTLTIESWRNDDLALWQEKIIPAFEAKNPGIKVQFTPSAPTEYNAALNAKLQAGSAGDLITCRPFDASLQLFKDGNLAPVNDIPNLANFGPVAKSGWSTDDGATTFCVPMASVIHGFIYNKEAFAKAGVTVPTTEDEFFAALDQIKAEGSYVPMAMGTNDQWEAATMGYQNIGPNYWKGEDGRNALIKGTSKLTDAQWVNPTRCSRAGRIISAMASRPRPILTARTCSLWAARRSIQPVHGKSPASAPTRSSRWGAVLPAGKKAGDECYISDHVDIAIGMNAKGKNQKRQKPSSTGWRRKSSRRSTPTRFRASSPRQLQCRPHRSAGSGNCRLARQVQVDDPLNLPDPFARHAQSRKRDLVASANVIKGAETPEAAAERLRRASRAGTSRMSLNDPPAPLCRAGGTTYPVTRAASPSHPRLYHLTAAGGAEKHLITACHSGRNCRTLERA